MPACVSRSKVIGTASLHRHRLCRLMGSTWQYIAGRFKLSEQARANHIRTSRAMQLIASLTRASMNVLVCHWEHLRRISQSVSYGACGGERGSEGRPRDATSDCPHFLPLQASTFSLIGHKRRPGDAEMKRVCERVTQSSSDAEP